MKKIKYYPIWVASLALLTDSSVFACSCGGESSLPDAFAGAHEVFAGTVIDIARFEPVLPIVSTVDPSIDPGEGAVEPPPIEIIPFLRDRVTFQVIETWKGSNTITKVVLTGQGNGDCGVPFAQGSDYMVYTSDSDFSADAGFVHACSRTRLHFLAAADLQFLGAGQKPIHPVLNILRNHSTTILSWQTNWTNFRLEAAESLRPPLVWKPVSNHVGVTGGYYVVTNGVASPRFFFRLAR